MSICVSYQLLIRFVTSASAITRKKSEAKTRVRSVLIRYRIHIMRSVYDIWANIYEWSIENLT
jgi:hypothetical protein